MFATTTTRSTEAGKLEASRREIEHIFLKTQEVTQLCLKQLVTTFEDEDVLAPQKASEATNEIDTGEPVAMEDANMDGHRVEGEDGHSESKQSDEQGSGSGSDVAMKARVFEEILASFHQSFRVCLSRVRSMEDSSAMKEAMKATFRATEQKRKDCSLWDNRFQRLQGKLTCCPQAQVGIPPLIAAALASGKHYLGDISIPAFMSESAEYRVTTRGWSSGPHHFTLFCASH